MPEPTLHDKALSSLHSAAAPHLIPARTLLKNLDRLPAEALDPLAAAMIDGAKDELRPLLQALDVALAKAAEATVDLQAALPHVVERLPADIREVAKAALQQAATAIAAQQKVLRSGGPVMVTGAAGRFSLPS